MATITVLCPTCNGKVVKNGLTKQGKQRFICQNVDCETFSFIIDYTYHGCKSDTKEKVIDMSLNGSGIRDIARVLKISVNTVLNVLKLCIICIHNVNDKFLNEMNSQEMKVVFCRGDEVEGLNVEMDEMWSYVENKGNQHWIWYAIDHKSGKILAYVFGDRKDKALLQLKKLLEPFGISRYFTDDWGAYKRNLAQEKHTVGKKNTQKIERKNLTLRTRIKRLARKTICFSKSMKMHEIVIGLFINRYEFGVNI